ncbi:hypothetical protein [Pseudomonas aeruginosa]|uniref:hypothetical protein n=1 Tax=Pseudomonas aeruginosa TaxID=287 RepID=UPI0029C0B609|nr:hypothetical protein [Pseudomonas aeruginosa]
MTYALRQPSFVRLKAQLSLNGRFNHTLYDAETRQAVHATLDIERGTEQVSVVVRMGSTLNSLGLPIDAPSNAHTVTDYLESIANGRLDTADATPARHRFDQAA